MHRLPYIRSLIVLSWKEGAIPEPCFLMSLVCTLQVAKGVRVKRRKAGKIEYFPSGNSSFSFSQTS